MIGLIKTSGAVYDETRILILAFLLKYGECCVCELTTSLNLGQSRISRHLSILEDAGFLETNRNGRWVYYAIVKEKTNLITSILDYIDGLKLELPSKIDACDINKDIK